MTDPARPGRAPSRRGIRRCPICRKPTVAAWRPFCSKHCADADLGRWLAGDYRIPVVEDDAGGPGAADGEDDDGTR